MITVISLPPRSEDYQCRGCLIAISVGLGGKLLVIENAAWPRVNGVTRLALCDGCADVLLRKLNEARNLEVAA